ncbi:hypothetical protein DFR58_13620 [Anaerobacterium chartisolvens]|uniref:L-2-amino-thiazoline-4-carboxylic acid hydrolase-like protein n=1 Tax=Anaerobacterium chartisolvens TaxID=1297424 RepID=A0A369APG6_9FIRM|nr:hypothetical protein [Anaerobacterium chartisolvens]RCX09344.1 hypothetical protein DFR58_13620 [Anaerobacterium chartisolvens]
MTVHDFIVIYNESFKYIKDKYGAEALKDLWSTISKQWCTHLDGLVKEKGLEGMVEYWDGDDGTLGREQAVYSIKLENGLFTGIMHKCPSVGELVERNREICSGVPDYCDHCMALYAPIAEKYGIKMLWSIEHDSNGVCQGRCKWSAYQTPL